MKKISTNQIVSVTSKQPFTGRSLEFLQDALDEDKAGIIQALVTNILGSYSLTVPYVISGCVVSDSNKDVTAGEVFYGGKYYETTAVNGTTNTAQFVLTKTQDATADPVIFTDSTSKNVHDIYKFVATDTATPGTFDATDLVYLSSSNLIASELTLSTQTSSSSSYADLTGLTYTTPNDGVTRKYEIIFKAKSVLVESTTGGSSISGQGEYRIYNDTDASLLDETSHKLKFDLVAIKAGIGTAADYGYEFDATVVCCTIVTLAPNKTIKCQFKKTSGVNVVASNCKMLIKELR